MPARCVLSADDWARLQADHLPGYDPYGTAEGGDRFDVDEANARVDFIQGLCQFIEGKKAGQPFMLEPWQMAGIGAMFGWKRSDGTRRYREAFWYVPRKNGKTPMSAAIMLCVLFCDHEPGAQLYSAAADREQAALMYRHASQMVARNEILDSRVKIYKSFKSMEKQDEGAIFKALSAEADTKHGLNVHFVNVDELHAHPNGELTDVLTTGTASRAQPLTVYTTTADFSRPSPCNQKLQYARSIMDGKIKDHSFLPIVYEATLQDDWKSEEVWRKANPNLGVSVNLDYLKRECLRAQDEPSYENTFKRLHLNIVTEQAERWLPVDRWDLCNADPGPMEGRQVVCGLDLATTTDIAAAVFTAERDDFVDVWCKFWIPRDSAERRERKSRVPYLTWANQGYITLTPGEVIDYRIIRRDLNAISGIKEVAFDPWNATQLANELAEEDGFSMVEFRQGYKSMSEPSKNLEKLVTSKRLRHGSNPVLDWMARNVAIETDPAGNIKPSKKHSTEKIDGIVALVMSIGRLMFCEDSTSVYESRGPLVL